MTIIKSNPICRSLVKKFATNFIVKSVLKDRMNFMYLMRPGTDSSICFYPSHRPLLSLVELKLLFGCLFLLQLAESITKLLSIETLNVIGCMFHRESPANFSV